MYWLFIVLGDVGVVVGVVGGVAGGDAVVGCIGCFLYWVVLLFVVLGGVGVVVGGVIVYSSCDPFHGGFCDMGKIFYMLIILRKVETLNPALYECQLFRNSSSVIVLLTSGFLNKIVTVICIGPNLY